MPANVYVDGFNLYYCCLKGSPYKWLNLHALASLAFPSCQINRIRYFSARVKPTPTDPQKPQRQQVYLRALATIPDLSLHFGRFQRNVATKPLATSTSGQLTLVDVIDTKEKGSDVNLATYLLLDAFDGSCDMAIVVSNDSDLLEPVMQVRLRFGVHVAILCPQRDNRKRAYGLLNAADSYRPIRRSMLKRSQFPVTLSDEHGTFTKPVGW